MPDHLANDTVCVRVRLFAGYREAAGTNRLDASVARGARVADLAAQLSTRVPALAATGGMVAVNQEYVGPEFALNEGDEVAFIPPVSGGQE